MDFSFNSVEIIPGLKAAAAFTVNSSNVFKETESAKKTTLILCISNKSHYLCVEIKLVWKNERFKQDTSRWLAEQLGKNTSTISKWCTNTSQPDLQTLDKIAELLDCEKRELITK